MYSLLGNTFRQQYPLERDDNFIQIQLYKEELRRRGYTVALPEVRNENDLAAAALQSANSTTLDNPVAAFQLFNFNHVNGWGHGGGGGGGGHGSDDHHVSIDIPSRWQLFAIRPPPAPLALIRSIFGMSMITLIIAISTVFYKPASGVIFGHHKLVYYLALCAIMALGLGQAIAAVWLSRPGGSSRGRLTFGKAVLFVSILNFVGAAGIAGYTASLAGANSTRAIH